MTFLGLNSRAVTVKNHIYNHPKFKSFFSLCRMMAKNVATVMLVTFFGCWQNSDPAPPYKDRKLVTWIALTSTIVAHNCVINIILTINVPIAIYLFKNHNLEISNKKFHKNFIKIYHVTLYSFILTIELGWISTWSCTIIYFIFRSTATALFLSFGSVQNFIITFRFKNLEIWNDEFKKMKNLLFLTNWILLHADRGKFFNRFKKGPNR